MYVWYFSMSGVTKLFFKKKASHLSLCNLTLCFRMGWALELETSGSGWAPPQGKRWRSTSPSVWRFGPLTKHRHGGDITDCNIPKYSVIAISVISVIFRNIRNKSARFSRFHQIWRVRTYFWGSWYRFNKILEKNSRNIRNKPYNICKP